MAFKPNKTFAGSGCHIRAVSPRAKEQEFIDKALGPLTECNPVIMITG